MFVVSILIVILGFGLFYYGASINNDMDAQMESIFNNGIANPGADYENWGIGLMVVGGILFVVALFMFFNKKSKVKEVNVLPTQNSCPYCGSLLPVNAKFCPSCNCVIKAESELPCEDKSLCEKCGAELVENSKFCHKCGREVKVELPKTKFCAFCGTELPADSLFCVQCGKAVER